MEPELVESARSNADDMLSRKVIALAKMNQPLWAVAARTGLPLEQVGELVRRDGSLLRRVEFEHLFTETPAP